MRLQIIFRGLCAFVPNEASGASANTAIQALLIEGRTPTLQKQGSTNYHVAHIASLRFNLEDLDPDHKEFLPNYYVDSKKSEGIWFLDRDDLEILVDGMAHTGTLTYDSTDMFKMDKIYRNFPNSGDNGLKVKQECLNTFSNPANSLADAGLVGRIKLAGGDFRAFKGTLGTEVSRRVKFVKSNGSEDNAGGNTWALNRVANSTIYKSSELSVYKIAVVSKTISKGLVFSSTNGRVVRLFIENEPSPDRVKMVGGRGFLDEDFRLIYKIAQNVAGANLTEDQQKLPKDDDPDLLPPPILCGSAMFNIQS